MKRWDDTYAAGAISVNDRQEKRLELALEKRALRKGRQETQGQLDAVHASLNELDAVLDKLSDVCMQWGGDDCAQLTKNLATELQKRRGEIQARLDQASVVERQQLLVAFNIAVSWNPGNTQMPVEIRGAVEYGFSYPNTNEFRRRPHA